MELQWRKTMDYSESIKSLFPPMKVWSVPNGDDGYMLHMSFGHRKYHMWLPRDPGSDSKGKTIVSAMDKVLGTPSHITLREMGYKWFATYSRNVDIPQVLSDNELAYLNYIGIKFDSLVVRDDLPTSTCYLFLFDKERLVYVNYYVYTYGFLPYNVFQGKYTKLTPNKVYTLQGLGLERKDME